jgi:hypothetical protein
MNCQAVQNQILMLSDPRELSSALREHVLTCEACQTWARHAARLEAILEHLPAPPAPEQKKEAMIGDLMQVDPVIHTMPTPAARPSYGLVAVRFLRRHAAYVGGLAAAVLVAVGIYWIGRPSPVQPEVVRPERYPLTEKLVARDVALARAKTPAERLQIFNSMAEDISTETRGMALLASDAELRQMAGWYEKAVKSGMVAQASNLPDTMDPAEKTKLLDSYAAKLNADAAAAESLSPKAPPAAQPALKQMADSAREGEKKLRETARGGK